MTISRSRSFLVVAGIVAIFLACNMLIRLNLPNSLDYDEAEQVFFSQWLQWGYRAQPPLYNWLQMGVFSLFGRSLFSLSILKHVVLFSCYVFYWLAADQALKDNRLKAAATLGLLALPQVSFRPEKELTHTVLLLAVTALFLYAFFRILRRKDLAGYGIAGVAIGLGALSKYNFVLLPLAAVLAIWPVRALRDRVLDRRFGLAVVIAVVIAAPHGLWVLANPGAATGETLDKMTGGRAAWDMTVPLIGMGELFTSAVLFCAILMLVFVALFGRSARHILSARSTLTGVTERMVFFSFVGLAVVVLATGTVNVSARWLDPFLLVAPLYLAMKIKAAGAEARLDRPGLLAVPIVCAALVPVAVFGQIATTAWLGGYDKSNIPFRAFAEELARRLPGSPSLVAADEVRLAGNLMLAMPGTPTVAARYPAFTLPRAGAGPVVMAWRTQPEGGIPQGLKDWAAGQGSVGPVVDLALPYQFSGTGDRFGFSYAIVETPP